MSWPASCCVVIKFLVCLFNSICWVNTWGESPSEMPVGGYKESGIGRENGVETLNHYTQTKSVQIEMGPFESVF